MVVQEFIPEFVSGARIAVIGVGWSGGNTVDRMIREGLDGIQFIVVNTDAQALAKSLAPKTLNIGMNLTKGLWAGAVPDIGRKAAEESIEDIKHMLRDVDMVFITAGMGWGTGTGAAPVIAELAKQMGILTIGVVTKPFSFEGKRRFASALEGLEKMKHAVDSLIVIPNDKIFNIIDKKTTFKQAFSMIDKVLYLGVQGISDLIVKPGDINVDFADIKMSMTGSGTALLGIGYGSGENRAVDAARRAVDNPLLETSLEGAKNIIFAVTGGDDLTPIEVQEAARVVQEIADPDAMIVWGMSFDESYEGEVKVTIVATGFPDNIQQAMIKNVWQGMSNKFNMPTTPLSWGSMTNNFVSRAMQTEGVNSQSQSDFQSTQQPNQHQGVDLETPAFLRRKLLW